MKTLTLIFILSFCFLTTGVLAQEGTQQKKSKSLTMDDFDKPTVKPAENIQSTEPAKSPAIKSTDETSLVQKTEPVDETATWPDWAKAQKSYIEAYFQSQANGQIPDPYFCRSLSNPMTNPFQAPVNMRGLYGWKILAFQATNYAVIWKVKVDAPAGRSSTAGMWFIKIVSRAGDNSGGVCIDEMSLGSIPSSWN